MRESASAGSAAAVLASASNVGATLFASPLLRARCSAAALPRRMACDVFTGWFADPFTDCASSWVARSTWPTANNASVRVATCCAYSASIFNASRLPLGVVRDPLRLFRSPGRATSLEGADSIAATMRCALSPGSTASVEPSVELLGMTTPAVGRSSVPNCASTRAAPIPTPIPTTSTATAVPISARRLAMAFGMPSSLRSSSSMRMRRSCASRCWRSFSLRIASWSFCASRLLRMRSRSSCSSCARSYLANTNPQPRHIVGGCSARWYTCSCWQRGQVNSRSSDMGARLSVRPLCVDGRRLHCTPSARRSLKPCWASSSGIPAVTTLLPMPSAS